MPQALPVMPQPSSPRWQVLSDPDRRAAYDQNSDFIMSLGQGLNNFG